MANPDDIYYPDDPTLPHVMPERTKSLAEMREQVFRWTVRKGWSGDGRTFGDEIALIHSEASEALDAYREHGFADVTLPMVDTGAGANLPKPEGVGSELADILVRLLDTCARHDINLEYEFDRKMAYNETRTHRHGGKLL